MTESDPASDTTELRQISIRIPADLLREIDDRRAALDLSRDQWVRRAFAYCISQPLPTHNP